MDQKSVDTASKAIEIAREVAQKAGIGFHIVTRAKREGAYWLVDFNSFAGSFRIKINAINGEVVEYSPIE